MIYEFEKYIAIQIKKKIKPSKSGKRKHYNQCHRNTIAHETEELYANITSKKWMHSWKHTINQD